MPSQSPSPTPGTVAGGDMRISQYLPRELLAKLQQARASGAMGGERRIVTMLFSDVKGSTEAASSLDPEEWAEIMNGAFEYLIRPVYKYEGFVARLMGDSILAFFGAPIAHEDDPQRAVLAGLDIHKGITPYREEVLQRWGLEFDVRVGINTGLVVVGSVGSDLRLEYTALGDAINLASRMEQTAWPGTVQISENTYKYVAPLFEFENLGRIEIRGKTEPVQAYSVLAPRIQPGSARGIEGLASPLVGRSRELETLQEAMVELQAGRGSIISVVGEAGLGKSRLVAEVMDAPLPGSTGWGDIRWVQSHTFSYQTSTPYASINSLFHDYFGLASAGDLQARYKCVVDGVEVVLPGGRLDIAPFIGTMLGLPLDDVSLERVKYLEPPQLHERIRGAVTWFIEVLARRNSLVLVFDDLHWADHTSIDLLKEIVAITNRDRLMVLSIFRPVRQDPAWDFHEFCQREFNHRYRSIELVPLTDVQARELIGNLLYIEGLPESVRTLILTKAEGNPFFVEEVIRSLLDANLVVRDNGYWRATGEIEGLAVPATLAAVITSRLDRLGEEARGVLQTASVIGRQFEFETLAAIHPHHDSLEGSLADLQKREMIREIGRDPQRTFRFKHALTQETAYSTLLRKTSRDLHRKLGQYYEAAHPDQVSEIGRHYLEAGEHALALPYLIQAGERAGRSYSTAESIAFFKGATEILESINNPELSRRAFEGLGSAQTFALDLEDALETYQVMLKVGEKFGDVPMQVSALNKKAHIQALFLGDFETAEALLAESDRRARDDNDVAGISEMSLIRCMMCTFAADFDGVVRYMDETVELNREIGSPEQVSMALAHIATSQAFMLEVEKSWGTVEEGLRVSRDIGDRMHEAELLGETSAMLHWLNGEFDASTRCAEQGVEIAQEIGYLSTISIGNRNLGQAALWRGEYEEALLRFEDYRKAARDAGYSWGESEALCLLGKVYLVFGSEYLSRLAEYHTEAQVILDTQAGILLGASAWADLGFCARALGEPGPAEKFFELGLTTPTMFMYIDRPRLLLGKAYLALDRGQVDVAAGLVEQAWDLAEARRIVPYLPLIRLGRGRVLQARGMLEAALVEFLLAEEQSSALSSIPLAAEAMLCAAGAHEARMEQAKAESTRQTANDLIRSTAASIQAVDLRQAYLDYHLSAAS